MSSLFALRALLFAGECFAASTLLLSLAWAASAFLRQASVRHFVWLTAFGVLLVLPVTALIVPPKIVVLHSIAAAPEVPVFIEPAAASVPADEAVPAVLADPAPQSAWPSFDAVDLALVLFVLWLAGFCWAALRLGVGALGLAALRRQSRPYALSANDLPKLDSNRRECELRLSGSQDGPMTWGLLRPVVLLPNAAPRWSRERLQAVLLHELAHVRRHDSLTQSLSLLACAFYWPNPLVWLGARALRREAEIAADDAVIGFGVRPSAYAGELLQLASEFRGHGLAVSGVSMAQRSSLEARVKSVLAPNQSRRGVTTMDALKIACLGFAATALLALARPDVVEAQDTQDATSPVSVAAPAMPLPAVAPVAPDVPPVPEAVEPVPQVDAVMQTDDEAAAVDAVAPEIARAHHPKKVRIIKVGRMTASDRMHMSEAMHDMHMDQAELDAAMDQARRARMELKRVGPEIERAIAEARIDERVAAALAKVQPGMDAKIAAALAKAQPAIRKAIAEAHISERVAEALRKAQPRIDAAIVRIHKRVDKDGDVVIQQEDQGDEVGDADDESGESNQD